MNQRKQFKKEMDNQINLMDLLARKNALLPGFQKMVLNADLKDIFNNAKIVPIEDLVKNFEQYSFMKTQNQTPKALEYCNKLIYIAACLYAKEIKFIFVAAAIDSDNYNFVCIQTEGKDAVVLTPDLDYGIFPIAKKTKPYSYPKPLV